MSDQPTANLGDQSDANLALVQQMGADWYDPIPTEQYTCFQDPEFTLSPRGHRMLAELRAWTIRGRKGGRTPHATKDGRALKLKQIAALLGWDEAAAIKVWAELEEHGLGRKDEKGWLWLCGRVSRRGRKNSESPQSPLNEDQEWEKFCTDNFPTYLSKQFQRLSKNERPALHQDIETWEAYEKQAAAQAMAAAREAVQTQKDQYLAERYRVKVRRFKRKADDGKADEEKPKPLVQLSLLWTPELSVQNSEQNSVHTQNGTLYKVGSDVVQTTLNKEIRVIRQSDSSSSERHPAEATTTNANPPRESTNGSRRSEVAIVSEALEPFGNPENEITKNLIRSCRLAMPDCTTEEIVYFVRVKGEQLKGNRNVRNPMKVLEASVPKCFEGEAFLLFRSRRAKQRQEEADRERAFALEHEDLLNKQKALLADPTTPAKEKEWILRTFPELAEMQKAGQA